MAFVISPGATSAPTSPKSVERRRRMAEAMLSSGMDASPIQSWTQGAARIAQGLVGGYTARKADEAEEAGQKSARAQIAAALGLPAISEPNTSQSGDLAFSGEAPSANRRMTQAMMDPRPQDEASAGGSDRAAGSPLPLGGNGAPPAPMQIGGDRTAIYQALSNPWLTPADRDTLMYAVRSQEDAARRTEDMAWRRQESARAQANADRDFKLQQDAYTQGKVPAGFRATDAGGYEPVPGGPNDPKALVASRADTARAAGLQPGTPTYQHFLATGDVPKAPAQRPLPQNTITALGDAGAAYADMSRIGTGFQDEFGGQPWTGDAANWYGRTFADEGSDSANQASWWQDYQAKKNVTRNNLFGSALTATEKDEFEKADINPSMSPDAIRKNLARQQSASLRAARKLADTYTRMGYPEDQIEAAIGVPLAELRSAVDPLTVKNNDRVEQGTPQQRRAQAAQPGAANDEVTATNPETGEKVILRNGQWVPAQ